MKKIILIFAFIITSITSFGQTFFERNKNMSFGVHFGAVDNLNGKHMGFQTLMVSMSAYGVYADIGGWPSSHGSDVRIDKWDDEKCLAFHVGYQFPFLTWLKITPLIGYYNHQIGTTDGSNWKVTNNGIHNHFTSDEESLGFDYGGSVQIDIKRFSIFGTFTKNMWYGGIGFNMPIK